MSETEEPEPRRRLGDFEIVREIGRGGMGVVYEARQVSLNRKVALKVLSGSLGLSSKAVVRFRREAEAAAKLHHTNIVPIYATGEEDGTHFYAMELIEGPSLNVVIRELRRDERLGKARRHEGTEARRGGESEPETRARATDTQGTAATDTTSLPPWLLETMTSEATPPHCPAAVSDSSTTLTTGGGYFDTVARLIAEVADALDYAHDQGVIHRDIKPSNLLLSPAERMSINDFGLARMLEQPGMTMTGEFMGSPLYMSPEQIAVGRAPLDHRTDIYSLGATLYELLTLQPPFPGERRDQIIAQIISKEPKPPRRLNKKVPVDLETICLKAMEKDPDRRYQTAGQLAEDLRRFVNRFAISAKRTGPVTRTIKWARRRPAVAALAALVVLVAVVASVLAYREQVTRNQMIAIQRQGTIDDALLAAMSGDFSAAEEHVNQAELLGAAAGWVRMLRGQIAFYQGAHYQEAVDHFEQATLLMPDNVTAAAMLVWAYLSEGRYLDYHAALQRLAELEPVTSEDFLFKALAESDVDPRAALALLDQAIHRRDSALARVLGVSIRARHALDTGELSDLELLLEDALIAKRMLPENSVALVNHLWVQMLAADVFAELGQAERSARALDEAERDAEALARFSGNPRAHYVRAHYLERVGQWDAALEEWRQLASTFEAGRRAYAQALYARGMYAEALRVLDQVDQPKRDGWFHVLRAEILAELPNGGPEHALMACKDALRCDSHGRRSITQPLLVLLLLGRKDELLQVCQEQRENPLEDFHPVHRKRFQQELDYLCGCMSEEELLESAGTSRLRLCEVHYYIGLECLAMGDRVAAAQRFRQSVGTHVYMYVEYQHSRIFLRQLEEDPTWPPWIPIREDATTHPTTVQEGEAPCR